MKLWKKIKGFFHSNDKDPYEGWVTNHDLSVTVPGVDMSKVIPMSPTFTWEGSTKIITKPIKLRRRRPGERVYPQKIRKKQIEAWEDYNRYERPILFNFFRR